MREKTIRLFEFDLKTYVQGVWDKNIPIVRHVVIEGVGIKGEKLKKPNLENLCEEIMKGLKLNVVNKFFHEFQPQGLSLVYILEESHFAIHSWPEKGYIHIVIVTCSKEDYRHINLADLFHEKLKPISTRSIKFIY